jgi:hypothetical protein
LIRILERPIQGIITTETIYAFRQETVSLQEIYSPKNKVATVNYLQIKHGLKMLTQHFSKTLVSNISAAIDRGRFRILKVFNGACTSRVE